MACEQPMETCVQEQLQGAYNCLKDGDIWHKCYFKVGPALAACSPFCEKDS